MTDAIEKRERKRCAAALKMRIQTAEFMLRSHGFDAKETREYLKGVADGLREAKFAIEAGERGDPKETP